MARLKKEKYEVMLSQPSLSNAVYYFYTSTFEDALKIAKLENVRINLKSKHCRCHRCGGEFDEKSLSQFSGLLNLVISGNQDFDALIFERITKNGEQQFTKTVYKRFWLTSGSIYEEILNE